MPLSSAERRCIVCCCPLAGRLYVTQIDADGGADVFFPEPAPELWRITEQSPWQEEQGLRYRYLTYERKDGTDGI